MAIFPCVVLLSDALATSSEHPEGISAAKKIKMFGQSYQGMPKQLSPLWCFLSLPLLFAIQRVAETALAPFEGFGKVSTAMQDPN